MDYRYASHTVYQIEYHFVWVTKYRYKVLTLEVAERVRELVRQVCTTFEIRIVKGVVSKDHVHILVSAPPNMAPSEIMRRIKGNTSSRLFEEFPHLKKRYWGRHFSTCTIQKCNSVRVVFAKFCFGTSNKAGKQLKKHLVLS